MKQVGNIRNFCIIAHIDHGKSTLADRMLELTGTISERDFREQVLDSMDLERERGITIKSHPVTMKYTAKNGEDYTFNLIDTPGHVDFSYEVSRSMAACEGAVLVIDAAQGVEAQTVANTYQAIDNNLEIIPVLNKIDLQSANVDEAAYQIEEILSLDADSALHISAKTGNGVAGLMENIVSRIPPPEGREGDPLRALVFDSFYDAYRGVIAYVRIVDGELKKGLRIRMMSTGCRSEVKEIGIFAPEPTPADSLAAGDVGYMVATIKETSDIRIGDTLTTVERGAADALPGFRAVRPMVFSGLYPVSADDYEKLKFSMDKLSLNDSSFSYQPESSVALGFGFRCGFLGLLHMEIMQERLRREFDVNIINTYPSVIYRITGRDGVVSEIDNPAHMPDPTRIDHIAEPMIKASIICHNEDIGGIMKLVMDRRGELERTDSLDARRVMLICSMPLNEILVDFHDLLKSISHGYASMDYEHTGYAAGDLIKLDILLNGEVVDAFSSIVHRSKAATKGRQMCKALKEVIPKHMFSIPVQAAVNKTIIARETIKAMRKDVTAKCYGGDVTRKRKLLERQKEGKKRMKLVGKVNVPQIAFIAVLTGSTEG
jgi:GTP-binding protein LepA